MVAWRIRGCVALMTILSGAWQQAAGGNEARTEGEGVPMIHKHKARGRRTVSEPHSNMSLWVSF